MFRSVIMSVLFILIFYECESSTISLNSPEKYASRRLNSPNYLTNSNGINSFPQVNRDSTVVGLQPPISSSLTQMSAPGPMFNSMDFSNSVDTGGDDSTGTTTGSMTTTENPILSDMKPDKVKFNLPAVLIVFILFIGVVVTIFIRITWLHALLVPGNKTSVQINGRFTLWGNNNIRLNRPNLVGNPLSDINSHFTRSLSNKENIYDDAWIVMLKILNAISELSEKWAAEDAHADKLSGSNRLEKLD